MDVLIKNMEMPSSCGGCKLVQRYRYSDECQYLHKNIAHNGRLKGCPLVELPSHGRIGDLDALAEYIKNIYCKNCKRSKVMCKACEYGDMIDEIDNAPTVLEANNG